MILIRYIFLHLACAILASSAAIGISGQFERRAESKDSIKTLFATLVNDANTLGTALQKFTGDVADTPPILDAAAATRKHIAEGLVTLKAMEPLGLLGAVGVLSPAKKLQKATESTVDSLIDRKAAFEKAGVLSVVQTQVADMRKDAADVAAVVTEKTPSAIQGIANRVGGKIVAEFDRAVQAYGAATAMKD